MKTRELIAVAVLTLVGTAFDADPTVPTSGIGTFATMMSDPVGGERVGLSLYSSYAYRPVTFSDGRPAITHMGSAHLTLGIVPVKSVSLELGVPLSWVPEHELNPLFHGVRLRDVRASARWAVVEGRAFSVAVVPSVRVLTGPQLLSMEGVWGAGIASQVAWRARPWLLIQGELGVNGATSSWSSLEAKGGIALEPWPWLSLPLEVQGRWYFRPDEAVDVQLPTEVRFTPSVRWGLFEFGGVAGAGLTPGVGSPRARVGAWVAFRWGTPPPKTPQRGAHDDATNAMVDETVAVPARPSEKKPRPFDWLVEIQDPEGRPARGASPTVDGESCQERGASHYICPVPADRIGVYVGGEGWVPVSLNLARDALPDVVTVFPLEKSWGVATGPSVQAVDGVEMPRVQASPPVRQEVTRCAVYFHTARHDVTVAERARLWACLSDVEGPVRLEVVGHTDLRGAEAYNWALSGRRARSVREYCTDIVPTVEIKVVARGEHEHSMDQGTDEELRVDRRVDVVAYRVPSSANVTAAETEQVFDLEAAHAP